jgi:tripartite-type tricarboxylate transporter receptor subunit TctC
LAGSRLPAGAPAELVTKLHDAVARAVADPEVRQQFDTLGLEGVAMAPGPFATFVASEARAAQEIARRLGPGARQ